MENPFRISLWFFVLISIGTALGQGPTLAGTGYADPTIIRVAPGEITTLYVTGLKTVGLKPISATTVPLPVMLSGISVMLNQLGIQPTPVPLLSIQQLSVCSIAGDVPPSSALTADCIITAVTVQIPFELLLPPFTPELFAELTITENGSVSKAFQVLPVKDNLHVINVCDAVPSPKVTAPAFCPPVATHADGNLITADDPAQAGEEIVIWAFGAGATDPMVKTGQTSPTPVATLSTLLYLQFDFRTNATPSRPYVNPKITAPIPTPVPVFAGLTPGQIGLYQVNVQVPNPPATIPPCTASAQVTKGQVFSLYDTVQSNLTIDLGASASFDGAAICVQPSQ